MKKSLFGLFVFFFFNICHSQQLQEAWAKTAGGISYDYGNAIAVDYHGGVYIAGTFTSTVFNIGNASLANAGGNDIFVAKFDTSGSLAWAKQYGGSGNEGAKSLAVSTDGSLYIADTFRTNITIGSITLPAPSGTSIGLYLAKLDNNGVVQWAQTVKTVSSGSISSNVLDIACDSHGSVYVNFVGSAKYSSSGNFLFAGPGGERGISIDRFDNLHTWSNSTATRKWYDSTGTSLGTQSLSTNAAFNFRAWGYKAKSPTEYYMIGQYVPLSGSLGDLQFGHNLIGGTGAGNCIDKFPVNPEADAQGNEFYVGGFNKVCTPGTPDPLPVYQAGSLQVNSLTGLDIYFIRNSVSQGVTYLNSTYGNGYTNETPSRIAIDTNGRALYIIGLWSKIADSSKFYFGNSVLTNNGNGNTSDVLLLKLNYGTSVLSVQAGTDKTICNGGSASIGNVASGGAGSYTYSWSPSTGLSNTSIYNPIAHPSVTTDYVVTVNDIAGNTIRDTVRVIVDSNLYKPTISLGFGGTNPFCEGGSLILVASTADSYHWSTGATSPALSIFNTDTITVTAIRNDGCIGTSFPYFTIKKPLTATPGILPNGTASLCNATGITLTAQDSENNVSYQWNTGAITSSIIVSSAGTYSVVATGNSGCASLPASKIVSASPPSGNITANDTTICNGDSIRLSINTAAGNSVLWNNGSTAPAIWVKITGTYTATIISPQGCTGNTNSVTVSVIQPPSVPSISAGGPTSFCAGGSVVLTAQNTQSGVSYVWSNSAATAAITVNTGGNYSVKAVNSMGCASPAASTSIAVYQLPTGAITFNRNTNICQGDSIQLTINNNTGAAYLWNTGATSQNIWVRSAGSYSAQLRSTEGCLNQTSNTITTIVTQLPSPVITQTDNVLSATPSGYFYQWFLNGNAINGAASQTLTITEGGNYSVTVTNNGCSGSTSYGAAFRIITPALSYQVYPNPATNDMKIVYTLSSAERVSILINDMTGQRIISIVNNQLLSAGEHQYQLKNVTMRLQKGFYSLVFYIGDKRVVQRVIIL